MKVVWVSCPHVSFHIPYIMSGCCGHVRHQPWRGVFISTDLFYQTKESKWWNGREGECSLQRALYNSSGSSLFYRGGYFPAMHFTLGFWSSCMKEIKKRFKSEHEIWSLHYKTSDLKAEKDKWDWMRRWHCCAVCCRPPWMRTGNLSSRMKIHLAVHVRVRILVSSSVGRKGNWISSATEARYLYVCSQRPTTSAIWCSVTK